MACNPTVQYNDFTGNGSTTQFTFTFPYDNTTDVHVRLGTYPSYTYPAYGTGTTEYQVDPANPTRVVFGTAPSGPIRIFRCTPNSTVPATFQAGSSIRSSDLNNNFNQILFISQDASIRSVDSQAVADTAYTQSNTAITTANTALTTANSAVTTANTASSTANAAQTAVANAVLYTPVANVAAIPGSPSNDDYVEVQDSTGIQSFSPLSGLPSGFVGASGLTARLRYSSSGSSWVWQSYFANDPEDRYFPASSGTTNTSNIATNTSNIATKMPLAGGTFTGLITLSGAPTSSLHAATKAYVDSSSGNALPLSGGTMTGAITLSGAPTANLHASTKQYVDDNKVIAIDAGNFDNGSSTISSTLTIDGGSF
tara:strand:+ start:903 stop:2009 length:1107 start_codon:yes stop_codon:yes gene_type:complete